MFLCLLLCLANFSVGASAASNDSAISSYTYIDYSIYDNDVYVPIKSFEFNSDYLKLSLPLSNTNFNNSAILIPLKLENGNNYNLSFTLTNFGSSSVSCYVVIGSLNTSTGDFNVCFEDLVRAYTSSDIGKTFSFDFKLNDEISNPYILLEFDSTSLNSSTGNFIFKFDNFDVTLVQTATEKKLDGILGLLQELWNSIKDGFSNLSGKVSELGSSITDNFNRFWDTLSERLDVSEGYLVEIKSFFHDLYWDLVGGTCKYGDEHTSLFERLGNRIGGFFDDLKLKIDLKVEEIKTSIHDFFVPPEGFFDTWKTRFNGMLEHNLGFVYQAPNFVVQVVYCIQDVINSKTEPELVFPKVEFDIVGYHVVLFEDTAVDFSFLESGIWATVYGMYKVMVHAILAFCLIKFAQDTWERTMSN